MSATFTWQGSQQDGTIFDIGSSGSTVNWTQSSDWTVLRSVSPIPAGQASYERYVRMKWSGTYNAVLTVKYWRSDTNTLATGVDIGAGGLADGNGVAFVTPSITRNSDAAVPTAETASNAVVNVDSSKDGSGNVYAPRLNSGAARWLRLQVRTTSATPAGDISSGDPHFQFTCKYTEN